MSRTMYMRRPLLSLVLASVLAGPTVVVEAQNASLRLADLEKIALEKNPTIAQAAANIRAAQGRTKQAGLYPNPTVGLSAEEVSPGPVIRGGEWGAFIGQDIVTAGKLGLNRRIAQQDVTRAEIDAEAQKRRVLNSVRILFYQAMAAQRKLEVRTRLASLVQDAVATSAQLQNVGQADLPDVLEIEVEQHLAELAVISAKNEQEQIWQQLTSVIGDPSLKITALEGNLDQLPEIQIEPTFAALLQQSPDVKTAQAEIARSEAALRRAQVEKIPNIELRGGVRYNRELLEAGGRPVGMEGFFDVGVRIPLFDRNQGNVEAARARVDRAQREVDRVRLTLRSRLASAFREYQDLRNIVLRYHDEMLPRARKAYELYLASFRQMAAAYPQALIAQRTLLQLQEDYDRALAGAWARAVEIQGLLLQGGLNAPDMSGSRESDVNSIPSVREVGGRREN